MLLVSVLRQTNLHFIHSMSTSDICGQRNRADCRKRTASRSPSAAECGR